MAPAPPTLCRFLPFLPSSKSLLQNLPSSNSLLLSIDLSPSLHHIHENTRRKILLAPPNSPTITSSRPSILSTRAKAQQTGTSRPSRLLERLHLIRQQSPGAALGNPWCAWAYAAALTFWTYGRLYEYRIPTAQQPFQPQPPVHWLTGSPNTKYSILCPPIAIYSDKPQSRIASLLKRIPRTRPSPPAGLFLSLFPPALQGVCFLATQAGQALTFRFLSLFIDAGKSAIELFLSVFLSTSSEKHHPRSVSFGGGERIGPYQFRDNLVPVFDSCAQFRQPDDQ